MKTDSFHKDKKFILEKEPIPKNNLFLCKYIVYHLSLKP